MPNVVMGAGADMAEPQRQVRLRALQGLTLALFVAAEHQRLGRRFKVKADHVPEFCLEVRIVGELKRAGQVRFDVIGCPDALDAGRRHAHLSRQRAHAPARTIGRGSRGLGDDLFLFGLGNRGLAATSRGFVQACQPPPGEPALPMDHHRAVDPDGRRRFHLTASLASQQNDACPARQALRRRRRARQPGKLATLLFGQFQRSNRSAHAGRVRIAPFVSSLLRDTTLERFFDPAMNLAKLQNATVDALSKEFSDHIATLHSQLSANMQEAERLGCRK